MSSSSIRIKTSRLLLTQFHPEDAQALAAYRQLPEVAKFQGWETYSHREAVDLISSMLEGSPWNLDSWYQLALRLETSGELIGDLGFRRRTNGPSYDLEIGYSLSPTFQKQGYMREAVVAFIDWAQKQLMVRRFTASLDPRNRDSARLLKALNFQKQAHFVESVWFKGAWADDEIYVLIAPK